jgi:hypothetical protein
MQYLNDFPSNKHGLSLFLKHIDEKSIRKNVISKYKEELKDLVYLYSKQISYFDKKAFFENLTLEQLYLSLGLKLPDYLNIISVYSPNIIITNVNDDNFTVYVFDS